MENIIREQITELNKRADQLENFAGLTDFGPARTDLNEEADALREIARKIEAALNAQMKN